MATARTATIYDTIRYRSRRIVYYSTIIPDSTGSLAFIGKIIYKIQPNQFHNVLLYNTGTEPQTILFYDPDEVQVPQVPRM
jgi:hypothetical protein